MKSIFDPAVFQEIVGRISKLTPHTPRAWGKMNIDQMLAHCSIPIESSLGKVKEEFYGNFLSRWIIKKFVLSKNPFKPNLPTGKSFVITESKDFEKERDRLLQNIKDFVEKGEKGNFTQHPFFGHLTGAEWGWLTYKHLDHHLRQFHS